VSAFYYLGERDYFLPLAFDGFRHYFSDKQEFEAFLDSIPEDRDKDRFLQIVSFYKYLIKEGNFGDGTDTFPEYINLSYKFIGLFSLIEAIYSDDYIEFYGWLCSTENRPEAFPINDLSKLGELYQKYTNDHGSIKKVVRFFRSLDPGCKDIIKQRFEVKVIEDGIGDLKNLRHLHEVKGHEKAFEEIAKRFYELRSKFVHQAEIIRFFGNIGSIGMINKKQIAICNLTLRDFELFFQHGLLKHFGYLKNLSHPVNEYIIGG
jgi:hypothetical protein